MTAAGIVESRLALVGPGRAGRAFARSWRAAGGRLTWVMARDRTESAPIEADAVFSADVPRLPPCDVAVLAVPDDAIVRVAAALSDRLETRCAFHVSGALGHEALAGLRPGAAALGSLHPVRPFTGTESEDWRGAFVTIEGDAEAADTGEAIVRAVGARPYRLSTPDRSLYHAAATLAAGGTAAVVSTAVRGWVAAGIPESIARETLAGLASQAASAVAAVTTRTFAEAFTGAIARREAGTLRRHLAALAPHPEALALYRALAEETLRRTAGAGREEEMREILRRENATS